MRTSDDIYPRGKFALVGVADEDGWIARRVASEIMPLEVMVGLLALVDRHGMDEAMAYLLSHHWSSISWFRNNTGSGPVAALMSDEALEPDPIYQGAFEPDDDYGVCINLFDTDKRMRDFYAAYLLGYDATGKPGGSIYILDTSTGKCLVNKTQTFYPSDLVRADTFESFIDRMESLPSENDEEGCSLW